MGAKSEAKRYAVYGASGNGKSAFTKKQIARDKRVIIFDVMDEYGAEGFQTVHSLAELNRLVMRNFSAFRIAYKPREGSEVLALSALGHYLMAMQEPYRKSGKGYPLTFVAEELSFGFPLSVSLAKRAGFAKVCNTGRHAGITTYGVTQRPAEISPRFRGNLSEVIVFKQTDDLDIQAAAKALGGGKVAAAEIGKLNKLEYLQGIGGDYQKKKLTFSRKS